MVHFSDVLCRRADTQPQSTAYQFFRGASLVPKALSFAGLWARSASMAHQLQSNGLAERPVLLSCESQEAFVVAFYACLLANAIAVPTAVPRHASLMNRLQLLIRDAQVGSIISDSDDLRLWNDSGDGPALPYIDMHGVDDELPQDRYASRWTRPAGDASSIAFLQYTSGSTGDPKGVAITHGNLISNCAAIQEGMGFTPESSILTALPLFHDMGLVGGVLESMYAGCVASVMRPAEFVMYPERWLNIISAYQVTISGGPNFMFDLAARNIQPEQMEGCDLSSWQVAFCGAEPIKASTIERFTKQFAPYGFKPTAFYPCYGMAESTLFITGKQIDALPSVDRCGTVDVVGCGAPRSDTSIAIVDPESFTRAPDKVVGEIWVSGASVALGYWQRPELTQHTFNARIQGEPATAFLRTGDLGYMLNGELYVTGRMKDLLIVSGKKYAPQDVEHEAEKSHTALRMGGGAAFSVSQADTERLVLVFELERGWLRRPAEWKPIAQTVRASVVKTYGVTLDDIVFIKPGSLPRTSSGKVRRAQCRADYLANALHCLPMPA